jgi:hypothetical protein
MLVPASAELPPRGESGVAKKVKPGTAAKLRKPLPAGGGSTT